MSAFDNFTSGLLDTGRVPDALVRQGIRRRLKKALDRLGEGGPSAIEERRQALLGRLEAAPVAIATQEANRQHYEVPTAFFRTVLGPRLKYSSGLWPEGVRDLAGAEEAMLSLYAERADLRDGQQVLDLGCGWGSFSLWAAERYPRSSILGVSNSATQRAHILSEARSRGLNNLEIVTADANVFEPGRTFDRIVSIEMLEHVRNYPALFGRIASWMRTDALFFAHIFCHRRFAYLYDDSDPSDWMARHFFTGGTMPSEDLFRAFDRDLHAERTWWVDGTHYQRTLEAWLRRMDGDPPGVEKALRAAYGEGWRRWRARWRIFFMACAELFGYRDGSEWGVVHYRIRRRER
ncbi:MAG: Trans-aconitate 2-methyltransferase [Candidatus Omnitrophica bacterium]|nr:Trans-aconitate 2-methyltransferase [Candidatus Omnitrophota bacterium]